MSLPRPGDPEYGFHCPYCRAAVTTVSSTLVECRNPHCDWNSEHPQ